MPQKSDVSGYPFSNYEEYLVVKLAIAEQRGYQKLAELYRMELKEALKCLK